MKGDQLGDRMKSYEGKLRLELIQKLPVVMRLDGKAFHTLTKTMDRPYDQRFSACMWETARYLAGHVAGCKLVYTQSDEISLLLTDYQTVHTQGWFGYDLMKMVSVSAAMAAVAFSSAYKATFGAPDVRELPVFDSRAWNLPREEVTNYFIWRQQDASRNSVQMLGQSHFSHRSLQGLSCDAIQAKLLAEKGINWNDCPVPQRRGVCLVRRPKQVAGPVFFESDRNPRMTWEVDESIPLFTADRRYVDRHVWPELDSVEQIQQDHAESDQ